MLPANVFIDRLLNNKGPTFGQLPKRNYEIDKHPNHQIISTTRHLQRSKYIKVDDNVDNYGSDDENKIQLKLAYCKSYEVEQKNRRILQFKSQFV